MKTECKDKCIKHYDCYYNRTPETCKHIEPPKPDNPDCRGCHGLNCPAMCEYCPINEVNDNECCICGAGFTPLFKSSDQSLCIDCQNDITN